MRLADRISLRQLRALRAVIEEGTISAAADRLNLTGPAVHNQLKTLENLIGAPVLTRESGAPGPTQEGAALLAAQEEIQAALERAVGLIEALESGRSGRVVLGVVSTAKYFAPGVVAALRRDLPGVEVVLRVGNRGETIAALARGEFDLCVMGRPPRAPLCDAASLGDHPHVLIAAADHPLAGAGQVPLDDLLKETFVMREPGSGTRILAERFLDDIGHGQAPATVEMSSNETIKQAVISGLGVALISAHTVAEELRTHRLAILQAPGLPIIRHWFLLTRQDRVLSPAARQVRDWITARGEALLPSLPPAGLPPPNLPIDKS